MLCEYECQYIKLGIKSDLSGIISFEYDPELLAAINGKDQMEKAFFNKPLVAQVETTVRNWYRTIEKVRFLNKSCI